ncbi:MAG: LCP family protein [Erysipelotrichaceae bacterium]
MRNGKNQTAKGIKAFDTLVVAISGIATVVFIGLLVYADLLPLTIVGVLGVVLVALWAIIFFAQRSTKVNSFNKTMSRILGIALSVILICGNVFVAQGISTLGSVTGKNIDANKLSVITLREFDAKELDDVEGEVFGVTTKQDASNMIYALDQIGTSVGSEVEVSYYDDVDLLVEALYSEEQGVILFNETYRTQMEEKYPNFSRETKVIHQVLREVENNDQSATITTQPFQVYLSGKDRYADNALNDESRADSERSDVNMVATINPLTKQAVIVSIPRDYYVGLACAYGAKDKLTHAGMYGIECSMDTVGDLLGLDLNYYVETNFSSLIEIIDAIGGIEINNPFAFSDGGYTFGEGVISLGGKEALAFSRARYPLPNGDEDRARNQQEVIKGILKKATSPAIIFKYSKILNAVSNSIETNMSQKEISALVKMQLKDMAEWNVQSITVSGYGGKDITYSGGDMELYVMYPDEASILQAQAMIQQVLNGEVVSAPAP